MRTTCDACRMVADGTCRGELRITGDFFGAHREDIEHLLIVTTTTEHLAKKLGRVLKRAFDGTVHYEFSHENKFAHVTWAR